MYNFSSSGPNISYSFGNDNNFLLCIKCQRTNGVEDRTLDYSKVSPAAYFAFLLGPIAALIVLGITSKHHTICVPYCRPCWNKYRLGKWLGGLSLLLFCGSLVGGLAMMLNLNSGYMFWPLPIIATLLMAFILYWNQTLYPKIKKIDKAKIVIDGGVYGDITFGYHAIATRKFNH